VRYIGVPEASQPHGQAVLMQYMSGEMRDRFAVMHLLSFKAPCLRGVDLIHGWEMLNRPQVTVTFWV
jgi:hypothetical protein